MTTIEARLEEIERRLDTLEGKNEPIWIRLYKKMDYKENKQ